MTAPRPATGQDPLRLAEARLAWLDRRQAVLAQNIANADTPGYRPRDIAPFAATLARAAQPAMTQPGHLAPAGHGLAARVVAGAEVSPDGNGVSLDEQALKVAETDQAHALAIGLHRSWMGLFRSALGRNG